MEVPRYPTRETRMSSGPRRSPTPAIPAGRGDGRAVTDLLPADASGQGRPAATEITRSGEQDMHMHPYVMEELARATEHRRDHDAALVSGTRQINLFGTQVKQSR